MKRLIYKRRLWWWGELTFTTTDTMDAWGSTIETEHEVRTASGKLVGYWAYGSYDPSLPYQGDNPFAGYSDGMEKGGAE